MTTHAYYPAMLYAPENDGWWVVTVPGINVNAQGHTREEALTEAVVILQEVIDDLSRDGHPVPSPGSLDDDIEQDGTPTVLPAILPAHAA